MVFSWMGGIGFFAIPFCGVYSFLHRTIPISEPEYEALCSRMHDTSGRLLEVGKQLEGQSSKGRKHKNRVIEFKRQVRNLEERFAAAETAFHTSDSVVLLNYVWLVVSMIGGCISVVWIVHLFVHNVFQLHPFLDGALVNLSGVVPMAGTLTFFLLSLHLLLATLAGFWVVTQFTTPFPVLHMQKGATTLNSILYNIEVLLIGSFAALYLCAISFSEYAANTCLLTQIVQKMNTVTYMHNIMTYLQYGQPALALAFPLIAFAIWKLGSCCTAERDEADE
ncbi:LMBR1 domain-containing protein 1 [Angomonas deanei]|nr:LMBR1 domain-containing protein 1 [Angomonas deanei]|eukprot:EPY34984.1 LMBR1 domain-containing protein 1 [Angomonas deanei]